MYTYYMYLTRIPRFFLHNRRKYDIIIIRSFFSVFLTDYNYYWLFTNNYYLIIVITRVRDRRFVIRACGASAAVASNARVYRGVTWRNGTRLAERRGIFPRVPIRPRRPSRPDATTTTTTSCTRRQTDPPVNALAIILLLFYIYITYKKKAELYTVAGIDPWSIPLRTRCTWTVLENAGTVLYDCGIGQMISERIRVLTKRFYTSTNGVLVVDCERMWRIHGVILVRINYDKSKGITLVRTSDSTIVYKTYLVKIQTPPIRNCVNAE